MKSFSKMVKARISFRVIIVGQNKVINERRVINESLERNKVKYVKNIVFRQFHVPLSQQKIIWGTAVNAMNE